MGNVSALVFEHDAVRILQAMAQSKSNASSSKRVQELVEEFCPGNKILDEKAFKKAMAALSSGADRQLLQDMRDAALEHDDEEEDDIIPGYAAMGRDATRAETTKRRA